MKKIILLILLFFLWSHPVFAENSLQSQIDAADEHVTLEIAQGVYEEKIVLSKPAAVTGVGEVVIRSCEKGPVVTISGEDVSLKNIKVEHCGDEEKDTAIYVEGKNHKLEEITVETKRYGIKLEHADHVTIQNSKISGEKQENGIDLWQSDENTIEQIEIDNVADGIYLEQSNRNSIEQNVVRNSRYGIHIMFARNNAVSNNLLSENITGAMLMETTETVVSENEFSFNNQGVNDQGLLLYLASETLVESNDFISNRVGMFVEKSENNEFKSNHIIDNFVGIQFKNSHDNTASGNAFVGNVNDAQAIESGNNEIDGNYWESSSKVDKNGDGRSEIPYKVDPYFLILTNNIPAYQLFFQSPGMLLLQNMMESPDERLLIDAAPLMEIDRQIKNESSAGGLWLMSALMIITSFIIFIMGRKRE